jgi:hypothetical protein
MGFCVQTKALAPRIRDDFTFSYRERVSFNTSILSILQPCLQNFDFLYIKNKICYILTGIGTGFGNHKNRRFYGILGTGSGRNTKFEQWVPEPVPGNTKFKKRMPKPIWCNRKFVKRVPEPVLLIPIFVKRIPELVLES